MANELDNLFEQYAKKAEAEAKSSKNTGYTQRTYEEVKYTGLETGVPLVVRALGGYPDMPDTDPHPESCARTVTICRLIGDDGKKFRVIRPSYTEDPNYILNKIISRVKQAKWVDKEKTFPVKDQYPEIYNIVDKNGLPKGDPKAVYDKGWQGREVLLMNVIDRSQMDWHKQNKHTMLLAKSINESNGNEYVEEGVSSYAMMSELTQLFKYYKSWENYDIAITKTGNMNRAFIVANATKNPEMVDGPNAQYISAATELTDEEKSWERYDLTKLFRVTTATKIYNKLKGTIARIDAALNTHFLTELEAQVEEEKKLFEELYPKEGEAAAQETPVQQTAPEATPQRVVEAAPVTRTRVAAEQGNQEWRKLPYGSTLSDELKGKIEKVVNTPDGRFDITWSLPTDELASCPNDKCGAVSPLSATVCPCCGMKF